MIKRFFILYFFWSLFINICANSQVLFYDKNTTAFLHGPKVKVNITLPSESYKNTDSIRVLITITNESKKIQKILFGKQSGGLAWGMSANVTDSSGKSVNELPNRSVLYSQIYMDSEIKKKGWYFNLKPKESKTDIYDLNYIQVFNFNGNQIPPGVYFLELYYFGNQSNKVTFRMVK